MTKLAPEWVRTSDPVIRRPARYRWTTAPAPVIDPKLMGKPVDEKAYKPTPKERPVDDEAYEPMSEGRPVADRKLMNRPVDEAAYEPTPRERPVDNQTLMERPMVKNQDR